MDHCSKFQLDVTSLPMSSLLEALSVMHSKYGGYNIDSKQFLGFECSKKTKTDGKETHIRYYKCCGISSTGMACKFKMQIREVLQEGSSLFLLYMHKHNYSHLHLLLTVAEDQTKSHGIDPFVLTFIADMVGPNDNSSISVLAVKPARILSELLSNFRKQKNDPNMQRIWQLVTNNRAYKDHLYSQVRSYVFRRKESFLRSALGGHSTIANNDTLLRVLEIWKLKVPSDYVARSN